WARASAKMCRSGATSSPARAFARIRARSTNSNSCVGRPPRRGPYLSPLAGRGREQGERVRGNLHDPNIGRIAPTPTPAPPPRGGGATQLWAHRSPDRL